MRDVRDNDFFSCFPSLLQFTLFTDRLPNVGIYDFMFIWIEIVLALTWRIVWQIRRRNENIHAYWILWCRRDYQKPSANEKENFKKIYRLQ